MPLTHQQLYASPVVAISDVRCVARDTRCSGEEQSSGPDLVFPRTGAFLWHVGRESVLADANHVLFFERNEPYRVSHPVSAGDTTTVLSFHPSLLDEALPQRHVPGRRRGARFPVGHCPIGNEVSFVLHGLRRHLLDGTFRAEQDAVEELAIGVLHAVADRVRLRVDQAPRSRRRETERRRQEIVGDTRLLLGRTYRRASSLQVIAKTVGASPFHLVRIFHDEVGVPIHRYRTLLRLREALQRLADGEQDLAKLAIDLGYVSHSHFTDAFRAAFGISPSECRRGAAAMPLEELRKILEAPPARPAVR